MDSELDLLIEKLGEMVDALSAVIHDAPDGPEQFGGRAKLEEGLADELGELSALVGQLLERAHESPADEWKSVREGLDAEFDRGLDTVRESFEFLHTALEDGEVLDLGDVPGLLHSVDQQLYWLRRRRRRLGR
jgi:hypothetical protein